MSAHKQAVRIRAVWRAGQQRQKVFTVDDLNGVGVIGCCDRDFVYLIRQSFIQHVKIDQIAFFDLIQIGEHFGIRSAGVCG